MTDLPSHSKEPFLLRFFWVLGIETPTPELAQIQNIGMEVAIQRCCWTNWPALMGPVSILCSYHNNKEHLLKAGFVSGTILNTSYVISSFNPHNNLWNINFYHAPFRDDKAKALRS